MDMVWMDLAGMGVAQAKYADSREGE